MARTNGQQEVTTQEILEPGKDIKLQITPPNFKLAHFEISGQTAYVQHRFSEKTAREIEKKQKAGDQAAATRKKKTPKQFHQLWLDAQYISTEGWNGIPSSAFRNAMISACRLTGMTMVLAKQVIFIVAEGNDRKDGTPLTRIYGKVTEPNPMPVRIGTTMDLVCRPTWPQWTAKPLIRWDDDFLSLHDVANLLQRAGQQVGIGEGRHASKSSNGVGWGEFTVDMLSATTSQ